MALLGELLMRTEGDTGGSNGSLPCLIKVGANPIRKGCTVMMEGGRTDAPSLHVREADPEPLPPHNAGRVLFRHCCLRNCDYGRDRTVGGI